MAAETDDELDVRQVPKSQRHPMIFARFDALARRRVVRARQQPRPDTSAEEFARDRPGAYDWRYLEGSQSERLWRIRIIRITDVDLPRLL